MSEQTKFQKKIHELIKQHSYVSAADPYDPDGGLQDHHAFDNLDLIELVIEIEDHYEITISDDVEGKIDSQFGTITANEMVALLEKHLPAEVVNAS